MLTGKKTEDREVEINTDNSFCKDKNFVVTGKFNKYKRSELEKMIENLEVIMEDLKGVEVDVNL